MLGVSRGKGHVLFFAKNTGGKLHPDDGLLKKITPTQILNIEASGNIGETLSKNLTFF